MGTVRAMEITEKVHDMSKITEKVQNIDKIIEKVHMNKIAEKVKDNTNVTENVDRKEQTTFNDLLIQIGGFGRWNWIFLGFSYISCLLAATSHLSIIYLAFSPDFRLLTDQADIHFDNECQDGDDHGQDGGDHGQYGGHHDQDGGDHGQNDGHHDQGTYMYDSTVFKNTVVTEWDLVCE